MKKLFAVLSVAILFSCGSSAPSDGTVKNKSYEPGYYYEHTDYVCVSRDKNGNCTLNVPIRNRDWIEPRWKLYLEKCVTKDDGKGEKCQKGWLEVEEYIYNKYEPGQHYP